MAYPKPITSEQARIRLIEGNRRFADGLMSHPRQASERRREALKGQQPFAIVLGCSDSRVPPETIFDQGLGDLFVIRVAGNVLDDAVLGSLEYGVEHLGVGLIVVLGHTQCGAVTAAAHGGAAAPGKIAYLLAQVQPAVEQARQDGEEGDLVKRAVELNALCVAQEIRTSEPLLAQAARLGGLQVVAAVYHLESGEVRWL